MNIDARELIILSAIPGIGSQRLRGLVNHFRDTHPVFQATAADLIHVPGIEKTTALSIRAFFRSEQYNVAKHNADNQLSRANKSGARILTCWDKEYPTNLMRIYDPPPYLFVRGTLREDDECSVAVVGTRSPTDYGRTLAEALSMELAPMGVTVVSGLARGIDTAAHLGALKGRGRSIAVIGSGIDLIYPPENKQLAQRLIASGALLSECAMGAKPDAINFPRRNRIISGISLGTLVVETGIRGGAMITAATALDQNREVFAVPASINGTQQSGANLLIKEGRAKLIENVQDILSELEPRLKKGLPTNRRSGREHSPPPELTLFEGKVYHAIGSEPTHVDLIAMNAGLSTADTLVHLLSLELKGGVRQIPGKFFLKT